MAFKILLVEDDNNLREIYEARLQAEGYEIVTARDGEEALGVAKTEMPDLVISDVMMPRVSGFEMLDILRNTDNLKDVKVIMLTALGQADDKTRATSLGADRYLVKSQVTLEDIVKTAHELLGDSAPQPVAPLTANVPPAAPATAPSSPVASPAVTSTPTMPLTQPPITPIQGVASGPGIAAAPSPSSNLNTLGVTNQPSAASPAPVLPSNPTSAPATSISAMPASVPTTTPVLTPVPVAPSTSEEQATVETQIDNFIRTAPAATPAPDPSGPATQDDAVLANAMHDLAASAPDAEAQETLAAPQPSTPPIIEQPPLAPPLPTTPAPVVPPAAAEPTTALEERPQQPSSVLIANKKIIQPLSAESRPSIHELAAREEANNTASDMPATGMTPPAVTTFSPTVPEAQTSPIGPTTGGPSTTPTPTIPQPPQAPQSTSSSFDPNSISL